MDPTNNKKVSEAENQPDAKPDVEYLPCKKNWPIFWLVIVILATLIIYACLQ